MQRVLSGNTATISFPHPIIVGEEVYTGPLNWEIGDAIGIFNPVDPVAGTSNAAVMATIDEANPQILRLTKVADEVAFSVKATYPGVSGPCSRPVVSLELIFAAPAVWISAACVEVGN